MKFINIKNKAQTKALFFLFKNYINIISHQILKSQEVQELLLTRIKFHYKKFKELLKLIYKSSFL